MFRSLVSYVLGASGADAAAAEKIEQALSRYFSSVVDIIGDSSRDDFRAPGLALTGSGLRLESCLLGIHLAHGDSTGFFVEERDRFFFNQFVNVGQLQPGWGETRYLWLMACRVLGHGQDPGKPGRFRGDPGEESVFLRWGGKYDHSGTDPSVSTSPLAGGLRLVCGTSTHLTGGNTNTILDLIANSGLGIADAFILGLVRPGQTPICATRANSLDDNPLFDQTWNAAKHTPGNRVYIQYPEVVDEEGPSFAPLEGDPGSLPLLRVVPDPQFLDALESGLDDLHSIAFLQAQRGDLGSIRLSAAHWEGALDAERFFTTASRIRQLLTARDPFISGSLEMVWDRVQTVRMKIDSFPIAALPADGLPHPMQGNFTSEVKCTYRLLVPRFRDRVNPGNHYEILDPDFGVLEGWTGRPEQDGPLIQSPILFARACSYVEGDVVPLIGRQAAVKKATEALQASSSGELEGNLDFQHPKVSLGYRLDRSEGGHGWLRPHYVVSFAPGGEANLAPRTVEVAGSP